MTMTEDVRAATPDPTVDLEAEIRRVHATELDMSRQIIGISEQRAAGIDGDQVLDQVLAGAGVDPTAVQARAEMSARAEVLSSAIDAARGLRANLVADLNGERARVLRRQAADLRLEATGRQTTTDRLLAELRAHEGVDYVPAPPSRSAGPVTRPELGQVRTAGLFGPSTLIQPNPHLETVYVPTPATVIIRQEADQLDRRAADTAKTRLTPVGGISDATSIEDLLEQLARFDPLSMLVPRLDHAAVWAAEQIVTVTARVARFRRNQPVQPDGSPWPDIVHLAPQWRDGVIDSARSRCWPTGPGLAGD